MYFSEVYKIIFIIFYKILQLCDIAQCSNAFILSCGIKKGIAIQLAKQGCRLVLWDINEEGNQETAADGLGGSSPLVHSRYEQ